MKIKLISLFSLLVLSLCSCLKKDNEKNLDNNEVIKDQIDSTEIRKKQFRDLIQKSLLVENADKYFRLLDSTQRNEFFVIRNDSLKINENLNLIKFGRNVKFMDYDSIKNKTDIFYLDFRTVKVFKDSALVGYYYNDQNCITESHFRKKENKEWEEIYTVLHQL